MDHYQTDEIVEALRMKIPKKVIRERFNMSAHRLYRLMDSNKELINTPLERKVSKTDITIYHKRNPMPMDAYCKEVFEIYNNEALQKVLLKKDLHQFCYDKGLLSELGVLPSIVDMIEGVRKYLLNTTSEQTVSEAASEATSEATSEAIKPQN